MNADRVGFILWRSANSPLSSHHSLLVALNLATSSALMLLPVAEEVNGGTLSVDDWECDVVVVLRCRRVIKLLSNGAIGNGKMTANGIRYILCSQTKRRCDDLCVRSLYDVDTIRRGMAGAKDMIVRFCDQSSSHQRADVRRCFILFNRNCKKFVKLENSHKHAITTFVITPRRKVAIQSTLTQGVSNG